ncbi:sulfotransferase family 2 domain-containing protein [Pseudaestuariivita atlantica]|uniref:Sulfotransferase family protein n=1 Tax=Pseudaestuariivita atlantica TaxID=1317121 RepID=A0A0L1JV11_9RHOB|nr:sulfotransferase family 2 domain-containing protein [Pseudaestuariivita atlantica]KNG95522.1 hypothetical protein ATO11_02725 [Pseudaestuariivita atlantica]
MVITVDAFKIAYMALPKAGCTSVKAALAQIDPAVEIAPDEPNLIRAWHTAYPTTRFRPHRWDAVADHWRFCVVRDPVKRLMSGYLDRVVKRGELKNSRRLARGDFPHLTDDPDPDFFFQNLWDYAEASSVVKHHVAEAWLFLGPGPITDHYDRIYRTEEMPYLAEALAARSRLPVSIPKANSTGAKMTLDDLKPATRDALRSYLAAEYAYLKGFYDNPMG